MRARAIRGAPVILSAFVLLPPVAHAMPARGEIPWDFIACKFTDTTSLPTSMSDLQEKLLGANVGSLADWVAATSYGTASLQGVTLHGYYTIPLTLAQAQAAEKKGRGAIYNACQTAAANSTGSGLTAPFKTSANRGLSVITWPSVDTYGGPGQSMDGADEPVGEFAHEFGHGLGLFHSWTNDYYFYSPPAASNKPPYSSRAGGDYGNPWDEMSYGDVYSASAAPYSNYGGGPGLDAYQDSLGWIPRTRILTLGYDGTLNRTVTIAPLNHPERSGYLVVRVPIGAKDPFHYFTVEYQTKDGWLSGIPGDQVIINEVTQPSVADVRAFPEYSTNPSWLPYYTTYLQRAKSSSPDANDGALLQNENAFGAKIETQGTPGETATVEVTTALAKQQIYGPNTCAEGYVWRDADELDYVCVNPATREQAAADNAAASERHDAGGDTCKPGYVWREAFPKDYVCVTPATRAQAKSDNDAAGSRFMNANTQGG
jgi:hypothetical protein